MIRRSGERGLGISVLAARHDDVCVCRSPAAFHLADIKTKKKKGNEEKNEVILRTFFFFSFFFFLFYLQAAAAVATIMYVS